MRMALFLMLILIAGLADSPFVRAETVGSVTRVQGEAVAIDGETRRVLVQGAPVDDAEQLETSTGARLEVRFDDGTVLTLGEAASIRIDSFVYQRPGVANRLAMFIKGAFRMVTGLVNKDGNQPVEVSTPAAALAVRGTDFWGGPIDGVYGVLLIEGEVVVSTAAGSVVLDDTGEGTNVTDAATAPSAVATWGQARVDRALAAVAFEQ